MQRLPPISKELIREMAEDLDCSFRVFLHRTTGHMLSLPDLDALYGMEIGAFEEEEKELEAHGPDYIKIEKWTSSEFFRAMEEFADRVPDRRLQNRLFDALSQRKPFRGFKFIVDNAGPYREEWFAFKANWQSDFVEKQLERLFSEPKEEQEGDEEM